MSGGPPRTAASVARRGCLSRRELTACLLGALASTAVGAHTPYGQWTVYRRRNLFIVASRTDAQALDLAEALAAGLARELPESRARMTRATEPVRVASLLATGQLDVAVVADDEAASMLAGSGVFRAVGPVPLRALAKLGGHVLVAVEDFKPRHAYLLSQAVEHLRGALPGAAATAGGLTVPEHAGAAAWRGGEPIPAVEPSRGEAQR